MEKYILVAYLCFTLRFLVFFETVDGRFDLPINLERWIDKGN